MITIFISDINILNNIIIGQYNYGIVALSLVVAIIASHVAFAYSERYRSSTGDLKLLWLSVGSIVMGLGVWSMHFIGMMAYRLPVQVNYDLTITIVSILPAIIAAVAMQKVISKNEITLKTSIVGGLIMGSGIGTMHYSGMMAMRFDGDMFYDPFIFTVSIFVAVMLAIISLSLKALLEELKIKRRSIPYFCCTVMGLAVAGMHYTGMSATIFTSSHPLGTQSLIEIQSADIYLTIVIAAASIVILLLAFLGVVLDRKVSMSHAEVKYNKDRLAAVMDNVMDGIITINADGVIQDFNAAAEAILGYKAEEVVNKKLDIILPKEVSNKHDGFIRRYLKTGRAKVVNTKTEQMAVHKNGDLFPIEIAVTEMWVEGNSNFVASFRDITKRKENEAEMQRLLHQQTKQAKDASDANEMKSGFLANMSHELRTPLNVIMGITELLKEDAKDEGLDDMIDPLERVLNSSTHLLQLINDILDLSKIEAGKIELHIEPFNLATVLKDVKTTAEVLAEKNNNKFTLKIEDEEQVIRGDSMRVKQILLNLLSNSFKFTSKGEVALNIYSEATTNTKSKQMVFTVSDTGIGMSEDQMEHLFQEFMQADSSTTKKFGGTGLGLAISKALAQLMGGDIEVESVLDEGTSFTLKVPLPPA